MSLNYFHFYAKVCILFSQIAYVDLKSFKKKLVNLIVGLGIKNKLIRRKKTVKLLVNPIYIYEFIKIKRICT
jgi:hypothetical protein